MASILCVDDNLDLTANMQVFLQAKGHEVLRAASGAEAYGILGGRDFDLLVLDWDLPDTTGPEICNEYRRRGGLAAVLMLTGRTGTDDKVTGLTAGADDYLTKPVNIPEFGARIDAMLRRSALLKRPVEPTKLDESMVGQTFAGYEIKSVLGQGSMGIVFEAIHKTIKRHAAIKFLSARSTGVADRKRFEREAKAMSLMDHPNLIKIYDFGVNSQDVPYIIMEYVEGSPLSEVLKSCGPLPVQDVVPLFIEICEGLAHAHAQSIIHRDLKPHNIIISSDGCRAKIVDLGVAKINEPGEGNDLTFAGEIFGSPYYMSPEQATNKPVDQRSDIYSLACVMYEVLIGQPPFTGYSFVELTNAKLTANEAPSIIAYAPYAEFPYDLDKLIQKMMERKVDKRPASVTEVLEQLRTIESKLNADKNKGKISSYVQKLFGK